VLRQVSGKVSAGSGPVRAGCVQDLFPIKSGSKRPRTEDGGHADGQHRVACVGAPGAHVTGYAS